MMFGRAATGAGVGVAVLAGPEGDVKPDPPQAVPKTPTENARTSFLWTFTRWIVPHRAVQPLTFEPFTARGR